ncbi:cupin domain-containing protein [Pseudosulfitobacter pseudonitzschiae]|uniref:cupin domain-containing protein n=1 Tax=Pseudosulfitobacter pseudonitzschiae TaxID=1402135 RepID=UPI001E3CA0CD|nr:cupin domain-containing protein [Pseudosulfitobacter pseudonitzschiae]MCD2329131.1 cupin domain-containing protein [Pseudosulfitobacter pseudonitzschiae]UFF52879.1 cupin domain-containing protein [Pseudosulfitobacter pseudonitzschiae]
MLRKGVAEFIVGDERITGHAGDIIIAPANVPHRYLNIVDAPLEMICIHPEDTISQQPA